MIRDIQVDADKLHDFLVSCGVHPQTRKLEELINHLERIIAIRVGKQYIGVETVDDIVVGVANINGIIERQELPDDILRGYYVYRDGKIILDEKLRQKIWG